MVWNCILLACLTSCLLLSVTSICPNGWIRYDDDCFALFRDKESWTNAKTYCAEFDGHLAQLTTSTKAKYARDFLKYIDHQTSAWVGGEDQHHVGTWAWSAEGGKFGDTEWAQREPSLGHCMILNAGQDYKWASSNCTQRYVYLCERRSTPVQ